MNTGTTNVFVDQTTFTTRVDDDQVKQVKSKVNKAVKKGWLKKIPPLNGRLTYKHSYCINILGGSNFGAFISFGPVQDNYNFVRVSFNPINLGGLGVLESRLRYLLGASFVYVYDDCSVTRTDLTVDMYGLSLEHMFIHTKGFSNTSTHGFRDDNGEAHLGCYSASDTNYGIRSGLTFGSQGSDTRIKVYDKKVERLQRRKYKEVTGEHWVRFEICYRRTGLPISRLNELPNKFKKIEVYDPAIKDENLNPLFFLACQNRNVSDALQCLDGNERRRHEAALMKHRVRWFDADKIWEGLPKALSIFDNWKIN